MSTRAGLNEALDKFTHAETARLQPALADIRTKVAFGRGRIFLCLSQALVADHWGDAEREFRQVVDEFGKGNQRVKTMTAESHANLGLLHLPAAGDPDAEASLRRAASEYREALRLTPERSTGHRKAFFWSMLGFIHGQLGETATAEDAYDHAISLTSDDPATRARYETDRQQLPRRPS